MLSYGLAREDTDFYLAGKVAICYCLQNSKQLIKLTLWITLLDLVLTIPLRIAAYSLSIIGLTWAVYGWVGGDLSLFSSGRFMEVASANLNQIIDALLGGISAGIVVGLFLMALIRGVFLQPLLTTLSILRFHHLIKNQELDPAWLDRFESAEDAVERLSVVRRYAQRV